MTMANLQKLNPTQQELYNYLEQQTGQVNFEVLQPFTTQEMGAVLHISRNTVSQYLNEFFKEGWMVKINTRPVYYFLRETLSRKFNVQTLDAEYEDLQFLQQDLNHGRRADSCFAGVIGYHLSLKSAVEKCRVAVEYPPTGLPLVLAGEKGTGKRLLAGKTWEYAKEKQVVPAESRFAELDCTIVGVALDNAIAAVRAEPDPEKRLIKVAVYSQGGFAMLRFEHYTEAAPALDADGLPQQGSDLKSVRTTVGQHGGSMTMHWENNWCTLRILFPLPQKQ